MSGSVLILSSARGLERRFGAEGAARLMAALHRLRERCGPRARLVLPDDEVSSRALGLDPRHLGSSEAARAAVAAVQARSPDLSTVWIIGGHRVLPFHSVANPAHGLGGDPDYEVQTDNAYGLPGSQASGGTFDGLLRPTLATARLPDSEPADLDGFVELIDRQQKVDGAGREGTLAVVDTAWTSASSAVVGDLGPMLRETPGWHTGDPEWAAQRARLYYFNMHGFDDHPAWRGFEARQGKWVDAVRPSQVSRDESEGTVVFAENCYGALVNDRAPGNSVALAFLAAGARAFVGATGLAFGSLVPALTEGLLANADRLAREFVRQIRMGVPCGRALLEARRSFVEQSLASRGGRTAFAAKTGLQFVLYGNPLATL